MRTFDYTGVRSDDVLETGTVNAMDKEEADLVLRTRGLRQVVVRGRPGRASHTLSPGVTVTSPAATATKPTPVLSESEPPPITPPLSYGHCTRDGITYRMDIIARFAAALALALKGSAVTITHEVAKSITDQAFRLADTVIMRLDDED